jgi:Zn-dependent protease
MCGKHLHGEQSESEVEAELKGLHDRKAGGFLGLLLSILLFIGTGFFARNLTAILVVVFVVFVHELGHAVGMRMFGYRNVQIFFVPLMGAVTLGSPKNPSNAQKAVVTLLGPLPGLILGGLSWVLFFTARGGLYRQIGMTFLFLNLFNLLPLAPLDGEKFFEYMLFARNAKLELAFKILTTLLLGLVAFALKSPVLGFLAVLGVLFLKPEYIRASLAQNLRGKLRNEESFSEQEIPRELLTSIKAQLEQKSSNLVRTPKIAAQNILHVWRRAHERAPSSKATLGLLFLYFGSLLLGFVAFGVASLNDLRVNTVRKVETTTFEGKQQLAEIIYQTGKLRSRTALDGELYHGLCEIYYPNTGTVMIRGYWDNGKWDGEWSYYDKKGTVYRVAKFQKGRFVSEKVLVKDEWVEKTFESLPKRLQIAFTNHDYGKPEGPKDISLLRMVPPTPPVE